MARNTDRAQEACAKARRARMMLLRERDAQDARIEDAVTVALLAIEGQQAAQARAGAAERTVAAALQRLSRERVRPREMAAMTGLTEAVAARLLKMPVEASPASEVGADAAARTEGRGSVRAAG